MKIGHRGENYKMGQGRVGGRGGGGTSHANQIRVRILGRHSDNSLKVFLLAIHSHLY